jgi:hypothetical protein
VLFVVGTEPIDNGLRIVNTHIDSPRIEFKTKPFRESQQAVLVDTQVHGGIKNYQWANVPLAITGRVDKADGTTAWIDIGNAPAIRCCSSPISRRSRSGLSRPSAAGRHSHRGARSADRHDAARRCAGQRTATDRVLALLHQKYGITAGDCCPPICRSFRRRCRATSGSTRALSARMAGRTGHGYVSLRAIAE